MGLDCVQSQTFEFTAFTRTICISRFRLRTPRLACGVKYVCAGGGAGARAAARMTRDATYAISDGTRDTRDTRDRAVGRALGAGPARRERCELASRARGVGTKKLKNPTDRPPDSHDYLPRDNDANTWRSEALHSAATQADRLRVALRASPRDSSPRASKIPRHGDTNGNATRR